MAIISRDSYFYRGAYGAENASTKLYGKALTDLNIAELVTLYNLLRNPSQFDPVKHPKRAEDMKIRSLERMLENGFIDQEEFEFYRDLELTFAPTWEPFRVL